MILRVTAVFVLLALLCSCESRHQGGPRFSGRSEVQSDALLDDLLDFSDFAEQEIVSASNDIQAQSADRKAKAAALRWKAASFEAIRKYAYDEDPLTSLLDTWSYCVRLRTYLQAGAGGALFAEHQRTAIDASLSLEAAIRKIAQRHLPPGDFESIEEFVLVFAAEHPMTGTFDDSNARVDPLENDTAQLLARLVELPFSPLLTFTKVNQTADSISEFNRVAARISDIMEDFPRESRWQMELLLLEFQNSDSVLATVESLDRASREMERLREVAERAPELAGESAGRILGQLAEAETRIAELRGLAGDLSSATTSLRDAMKDGRELGVELGETARAWSETTDGVRGLLADIEALKEAASGAPGGSEPFRIAEYRDTAIELRTTVEEIRHLVLEIQAVRESPLIGQARDDAAAVVETSALRSREVIDHAFRRALQVVFAAGGVGFALILALWLTRRRKA